MLKAAKRPPRCPILCYILNTHIMTPPPVPLLARDRSQQILVLLEAQGSLSNALLAQTLGVSNMTVRRDLLDLEHQGLVRRVHGGVELPSSPDRGFSLRSRQGRVAKQAIGRAAALRVESGETVYLDAGSTAMELALSLKVRPLKRVKIVTHAINIAAEFAGLPNFSLIQVGGEIFGQTFAATGPLALETLSKLRFDRLFLATQGFSLEAGLTDSNLLEAEVKQSVIRQAAEVILIADSSKWRRTSFAQVAPLSAVSRLITDAGFPLGDRAALEQMGSEVCYAPFAGK